jgi:hypothetical protein
MRDTMGQRPIGPGMGVGLDSRHEDALSHPLRREILRNLNADGRPRGLSAIAAALPPFTVGEVNYHVQVLRGVGMIVSDGTVPGPSGRQRAYRSEVAEAASALAVLRASQRRDRETLRLASNRPRSSLLSMFRTPRPIRSVRFGARRNPGPERGG